MMSISNKIFEFPLIIRESHLDTFGHVNNAVYLQLFEEARWEMITAGGFGMSQIHEKKMGPIILEVLVRFRKELRLRQEVIITTQLLNYDSKVGLLRHTIIDKAGTLHCEAEIKFALFEWTARKIIAPTPEWLAAIGVHSSRDN